MRDYFNEKKCFDCGVISLLANRSFRCKKCQSKKRKESNKNWQHKYYLSNKERINKRILERQNYRRHTDDNYRQQEITKYHNRQTRIHANGGVHTTKEWLDLVNFFQNRCAYCKKETKLTRDHIIPISRGGTNNIENIQPLCASCNSSKKNYDKPRFTVQIA